MANFIYSTSNNINSPFLIDSMNLARLDEILTAEYERLNEIVDENYRKKLDERYLDDARLQKLLNLEKVDEAQIEERKKELESRVDLYSHRYQKSRTITVVLSKTKRIEVESFDKAVKSAELLEEKPIGFEIAIISGEVRATVELKEDKLNYRVSPENLSESRDFYMVLDQWAKSIRPPLYQRIWFNSFFAQWLLWFLLLWIISSLIVFNVGDTAKTYYKNQAYQLLKTGITPENQTKATEILLALQSGYQPENYVTTIPNWYWVFLVTGFVICVTLTFKPKSILGIGKGQDSIKRWQLWIKIIFIVIPTIIFIEILIPIFNHWYFKI